MLTEFMRLTYKTRGDLAKRFSLNSKFDRTVYLLWFLLNARELFGVSDYWMIEPSWTELNRLSPEYGQFDEAPLTTLQAALWFAYPLPKIFDLDKAQDRLKIEMIIGCWKQRPLGMPKVNLSLRAKQYAQQPQPAIVDDTTKPISVFMYTLWQLRNDLQAAFPLDTAEGRQALVNWFDSHGTREHNLSQLLHDSETECTKPSFEFLVDTVSRETPHVDDIPSVFSLLGHGYQSAKPEPLPGAPNAMAHFGVNVFGNAAESSGMNKHSQVTLLAADSVNLPVCMIDYRKSVSTARSMRVPPHLLADSPRYFANIAAHNLEGFPGYVMRAGHSLENCYNIYYGNWEYPDYPVDWQNIVNRFDEVWAPSRFTFDTMSKIATRTVTYIPLAVTVSSQNVPRRELFGPSSQQFSILIYF